MLEVSITLDSYSVVRILNLNGHLDGAPRGKNLGCAAVSLTVRSIARLMTQHPDITVEGSAPEPGKLSLVILNYSGKTKQWLKGITDVLLQALNDIDNEYPDTMSIIIEEKQNGS